jgi:hypothetical protein
LQNASIQISKNSLFIIAQHLNQDNNVTIIGVSFNRKTGGQIIDTSNKDKIINPDLSAAVIVSHESIIDDAFLNILIIDKPSAYENIVKGTSPTRTPVHISLYFKILCEYQPNISVTYFCSFYDTQKSNWNESGCIASHYNKQYDRYECTCNHLTKFALLWLPKISQPNYLTFVPLLLLSIVLLFDFSIL